VLCDPFVPSMPGFTLLERRSGIGDPRCPGHSLHRRGASN
jgi:hypothetical protein